MNIIVNGEKYSVTTSRTGYFKLLYNRKYNQSVYKIQYSYAGSSYYLSTKNSTTFKINQKTRIRILTPTTSTVGKSVKLSGILLCNNKGIKGAEILVRITNGSEYINYTTKTFTSGYFTVNYVFSDNYVGSQEHLIFEYMGNGFYSNAINQTMLTFTRSDS